MVSRGRAPAGAHSGQKQTYGQERKEDQRDEEDHQDVDGRCINPRPERAQEHGRQLEKRRGHGGGVLTLQLQSCRGR